MHKKRAGLLIEFIREKCAVSLTRLNTMAMIKAWHAVAIQFLNSVYFMRLHWLATNTSCCESRQYLSVVSSRAIHYRL